MWDSKKVSVQFGGGGGEGKAGAGFELYTYIYFCHIQNLNHPNVCVWDTNFSLDFIRNRSLGVLNSCQVRTRHTFRENVKNVWLLRFKPNLYCREVGCRFRAFHYAWSAGIRGKLGDVRFILVTNSLYAHFERDLPSEFRRPSSFSWFTFWS